MRVLLAFFLMFSMTLFGQNSTPKITVSFSDTPLEKVLLDIENKSGYNFFYVKNWLNNTPNISGAFVDKPVNEVLDAILEKTPLNYYIIQDEKRIILSNNDYVQSSLPKDYFLENKQEETIEIAESTTPIYARKGTKVIKIGKANNQNSQAEYTLSGYVKNATTDEPVSNAVLLIKGTNKNVISDINGKYTLQLKRGNYTIQTKNLGFENSEINLLIYGNGSQNIYLNEDSELLDEVTVEADRDINIKKEVTGLTQVKVADIKNIPVILGERDVLKVATALPGIKKAGEASTGFNVRGGKIDQNLILLDDGLIYNPNHFFGLFSAINPFAVNGVDIYKGAIPTQYGGRLSSVFDIKAKNANTTKFSGEGSIGPVTGNLTLEIPVIKEKSSLLVGGRSTYSNWILRSLDDENLKNSEASFYDGIVKYHHTLNEKNSLKVLGYYSKDNFSITRDSLYNYSNRLISLTWNKKFNEKNSADIIFANTNYNFNIKYKGDPRQQFNLGYTINENTLKLNFKYKKDSKFNFNYGISGKLYTIDPGLKEPDNAESLVTVTEIPQEKALETAAYVSSNIKFNNKLSLDAGVRYSAFMALGAATQRRYQENLPLSSETVLETIEYDTNEVIKTYGNPEFRAALRYLITPDLSVKAGYNSMYQYIHTLSNNTTASPTDTWKLSDLNIKPQQSNQYSLGLYKNFDGNKFEISLEGYYKNTKNVLDYKIGSELFLNQSIETEVLQGKGKSYGVEFLIKKNEGKFNGWLSYSYSRSLIQFDSQFAEERVNNGEFFASNFDKPHDLSIITNYKFTKRFSFSANFVYQTGRPVTYPVGKYSIDGNEYVAYSERNKFRIPDYYRLDIGLNIEGNHKTKKLAHSFWNISVYNVLGRNNPFSVFFVTENQEIKAYQSSIFSVPIPTITYNFRF